MFPRKFKSARGFTLVEILVVVLILGIASAIIVPQISSRDDLVAAAAARMVMADVIYAQNCSIARQKRHFVEFGDQQYSVRTRDSQSQPLYTITHPVTQTAYTTVFRASRTPLEKVSLGTVSFDGATVLGFDEMGSPFAFDGINMTPLIQPGKIVVSSGGTSLTILIEPFTGEATVQ